jgi:hypothetical protein
MAKLSTFGVIVKEGAGDGLDFPDAHPPGLHEDDVVIQWPQHRLVPLDHYCLKQRVVSP